MATARLSPSGPTIDVETTTDGIENLSSVPGDNVTEAINNILAFESFPLFDDFIGGQNATATANVDGLFGDLGWTFTTTGGSIARPAASNAYVGAYTITATATLLSSLCLGASPAAGAVAFPPNQTDRVEFRVLPNVLQSTSGTTRVGLGIQMDTTQFGSDGLYFEAAAATSPNWRLVARRTSVNTILTSTIPWTPATPQSLVLTRTASNAWSFFIDGVLAGSLSGAGTIPSQRLNPALMVTAGAVDQASIVDLCRINYTPF